jgi:hypothetical protein
MGVRRPSQPSPRPHTAAMQPSHPTLAQDAAVTAMDAQHGQHDTDCFPCCHFATSPSSTPLDQFPEPSLPYPYHASHPDRASQTPPSRPERAERAAHSSATTPRPAPLSTHACTASSRRRGDTLALHRHAPTQPCGTPFCPHPL